jgi:next-to-BRCA1 protein 1
VNDRSESVSENSLASSSVVMPQSAPVKSSPSSDNIGQISAEAASVSTPSLRFSCGDSDTDSVSLMSVPSSDEDDDSAWEDSRSQVVGAAAAQARTGMEYVVLYDDSTSDEE